MQELAGSKCPHKKALAQESATPTSAIHPSQSSSARQTYTGHQYLGALHGQP